MSKFFLGVVFLISLNFESPSCETGDVANLPDWSSLTFQPGSVARMQWRFDNATSGTLLNQVWHFTSNASKIITIKNSSPEMHLEMPETLVLNRINRPQCPHELYEFEVAAFHMTGGRRATFLVTATPIVKLNVDDCSILSDEAVCACSGGDCHPPGNVTWFAGKIKIGRGRDERTLGLRKVYRGRNGTYQCLLKIYFLKENQTSIELNVHYFPEEEEKKKAIVGESFTVVCESNGGPSPKYTIIHNETKIVSDSKTYTINDVEYSNAGTYECIAENKIGTISKKFNLSVEAAHTCSTGKTKDDVGTAVAWHIVVTLLSGIIIGLILAYIIFLSRRRWFENKKHEPTNPQRRSTEDDSTYEEVEMRSEHNYQSLQPNASNDTENGEDTSYADLSKTRDAENTYQSLM